MRLIDVHLERMDENHDSVPYYYRSKHVRIRTDRGEFYTPTRIVSKAEYNYRAGVPLSRPPPLELAIDFKTINSTQMRDFTKNNDTINEIKRGANKFVQLTERAKFRLTFFQPSNPAIKIFEGMNTENKRRFLEIQATYLQAELGTSILTYPYLPLPFSEYRQYVDRYFNDDPFSTVFLVHMGADPRNFGNMLDYLVNKGSKMIGVICEEGNPIQEHILASRYANREDLCFIGCQVTRKLLEKNVSGLHPLQFSGIDMVAPYQRPTGGQSDPNLSAIEFFARDTLGFQNVHDAMEHNGTVVIDQLEIPYLHEAVDRPWVREIIQGYRGGRDATKFLELSCLSRIHECISSHTEFATSRQLVRSGESNHYFKMRPVLQTLSTFKQRSLD